MPNSLSNLQIYSCSSVCILHMHRKKAHLLFDTFVRRIILLSPHLFFFCFQILYTVCSVETHRLRTFMSVFLTVWQKYKNLSFSFFFPTERPFCEAPGSAAQLPAYRSLHVQSESELPAADNSFLTANREYGRINSVVHKMAHDRGQKSN